MVSTIDAGAETKIPRPSIEPHPCENNVIESAMKDLDLLQMASWLAITSYSSQTPRLSLLHFCFPVRIICMQWTIIVSLCLELQTGEDRVKEKADIFCQFWEKNQRRYSYDCGKVQYFFLYKRERGQEVSPY